MHQNQTPRDLVLLSHICYGGAMRTIPQRELRNSSGEILRAAERGEQFTITVDGRPVALLGPLRKRNWVPRAIVEEIFDSPTDESLLDDVKTFDNSEPRDPWVNE